MNIFQWLSLSQWKTNPFFAASAPLIKRVWMRILIPNITWVGQSRQILELRSPYNTGTMLWPIQTLSIMELQWPHPKSYYHLGHHCLPTHAKMWTALLRTLGLLQAVNRILYHYHLLLNLYFTGFLCFETQIYVLFQLPLRETEYCNLYI